MRSVRGNCPLGLWFSIITLLVALQSPAYAGLNEPEDTVKAFYGYVAKHQCEKALPLTEGYSIERCKDIKTLKVPSLIERSTIASSTPDQVYIKYHVTYTRASEPNKTHCDNVMMIKLVRREHWIMDWNSIATAGECPAPESRQINEAPIPSQPSQPSRIKTTVITATSPTPPPPPASTERAEPPFWRRLLPTDNPPAAPPTLNVPPLTKAGNLLELWPPEELQGYPGDERIIGVRPPDISPPKRREPKDRLPEIQGKLADSIRRVRLPEGRKLVALTFDLCEQADDRTGYDRQIVNYLRQQKLPATFFAGGKWLRSHEDKALQLMADPLFEIGNHGWTHGNLRVMRGQRMLDQIVWTQAEYNRLWDVLDRKAKTAGLENAMRAIPRQPQTLRFPYGTCDATSLRAANQLGLSAIQWDVVSGDAAPKTTPDAVARAVLAGVKPGSIVVFHANGRGHGTAGALPRIVESLRAKGYEFATVSNLLRAGEPDAVSQCYEMRPGDNLYIDAKFGEGTGER